MGRVADGPSLDRRGDLGWDDGPRRVGGGGEAAGEGTRMGSWRWASCLPGFEAYWGGVPWGSGAWAVGREF